MLCCREMVLFLSGSAIMPSCPAFLCREIVVFFRVSRPCFPLFADPTKAMSYQNTNSGAGKIVAQVPGAEYTPVTASEHTATGSDGTVYALANKENGVAFYHYVGANYLAGKAYLDVKELSAGTGVRLFNIFDEETETGIVETVNGNAQTGNEEIYDLTGRRVREARNGLYIVNGQRVIR